MRNLSNTRRNIGRSYRLRSGYPVQSNWLHRYRSSRGRHALQFVAALGLLTLPIALLAEQQAAPTGTNANQRSEMKKPTITEKVMSDNGASSTTSQTLSVSTNQTGSGGSVSHRVSVNSSATSDGDGSSTVSINGKHYSVPAGGDLHKTVSSGQSQTSVDVSSDGSGNADSTSTLNVQINSDTEATSEGGS